MGDVDFVEVEEGNGGHNCGGEVLSDTTLVIRSWRAKRTFQSANHQKKSRSLYYSKIFDLL